MDKPKPGTKEFEAWMQIRAEERGNKIFSSGPARFDERGVISGEMSKKSIWIIKTKHIKPNNFYVKVDGSDFYTAYWIANTSNEQQAISLVLETCTELDLGQVEIQDIIKYSGQQISNVSEVDTAIKVAKEKHAASGEAQLAAWITSLGGKW